jgi:hypothetical protein
MIKLLIFFAHFAVLLAHLAIFILNVAFISECAQAQDTIIVNHQLYNALIETPKITLIATKDLSKAVTEIVIDTNTEKQLIIEEHQD